jgi:hypothetical protein
MMILPERQMGECVLPLVVRMSIIQQVFHTHSQVTKVLCQMKEQASKMTDEWLTEQTT